MVMLYDSCSICSYAVGPRHPRRGRFSPSACPVVPYGFLKEASRCVIEVTFNIELDAPLCTSPGTHDSFQCRVARPLYPEPVRTILKHWFIDGFKDHTPHFLHLFIVWVRHPKRSLLPIGL